jgi:hypothetical protein
MIEEGLFESLGKQAVDLKKCKVLEKEVTGKQEPMILNAAYLISRDKVEDFKKEAHRLNQEIQAIGLCLEYNGPWPAYNFVNY